MHREGRTQEAIGKALDVPKGTVDAVIRRLTEKRSDAKNSQPRLRNPPPKPEPAEPAAPPSAAPEHEPATTAPATYRLGVAARGEKVMMKHRGEGALGPHHHPNPSDLSPENSSRFE